MYLLSVFAGLSLIVCELWTHLCTPACAATSRPLPRQNAESSHPRRLAPPATLPSQHTTTTPAIATTLPSIVKIAFQDALQIALQNTQQLTLSATTLSALSRVQPMITRPASQPFSSLFSLGPINIYQMHDDLIRQFRTNQQAASPPAELRRMQKEIRKMQKKFDHEWRELHTQIDRDIARMQFISCREAHDRLFTGQESLLQLTRMVQSEMQENLARLQHFERTKPVAATLHALLSQECRKGNVAEYFQAYYLRHRQISQAFHQSGRQYFAVRKIIVKRNRRIREWIAQNCPQPASRPAASRPSRIPSDAFFTPAQREQWLQLQQRIYTRHVVHEAIYVFLPQDVRIFLSRHYQRLGAQARIVPHFRHGQMAGFRFYHIEKGSIYERLGLRVYDIISHINGVTLDSPQKARMIAQQFHSAGQWVFQILRQGRHLQLTIKWE
jgi:hypothetical protein